MTEVGSVYGKALYELCKEEGLDREVGNQLEALDQSFQAEPGFSKLLSSPSLSKAERCRILDESFRSRVHPYVLNFLKLLTERSYIRHFGDCREAYTRCYHADHGILPVTAVTAVPLSEAQAETLRQKLHQITGKEIALRKSLDPSVLGGVRLDYDGQRLDGTLANRMAALRAHLLHTNSDQ